MGRYTEKSTFDVLFKFLIVIRLIDAAPMLSTYDIWGDFKNADLSNELFHKRHFNSTIEKLPRVLNFFPVPFEEECLSNDNRRKGVCMNAYECRIQSGTSHGQCALGFGVCCVFTSTCDTEVFNNITYFVNPDFPDLSTGMSNCSVIIQKIDPDIVQLKLDFIHFNLGQPNRQTGVCDDDIFTLSGGGTSKELKLCGLNSGQHAYFDVDHINDTIKITMNLGSRVLSRFWEVRIIQIPFTQRAPTGCLQYHTGNTGVIQTMNFAENGRHLANQDYNICMRQELGMCSIAYQPCNDNSFKIGPGSNSATSESSDSSPSGSETAPTLEEQDVGSGDGSPRNMEVCFDKILMPCDSEDLIMPGDMGPGFCELAHCGSSFCPSGEMSCRIESSVTPFTIGVQFGAAAKEESPEDNLGMCLRYEQLPCSE